LVHVALEFLCSLVGARNSLHQASFASLREHGGYNILLILSLHGFRSWTLGINLLIAGILRILCALLLGELLFVL